MTERIETAWKRGWYVSLPALQAGAITSDAHYYGPGGRTLCGTNAAMIFRWTVQEHCGVVPLCDECRDALGGGG